jgi:hypothetical protein
VTNTKVVPNSPIYLQKKFLIFFEFPKYFFRIIFSTSLFYGKCNGKKKIFSLRGPNPLARSARANRPALAPPLCATAKWAQDADVAHRSVTVALCVGPTHQGILPQFSPARACAAGIPSLPRLPGRLPPLLQSRLACARCLRSSCPPHVVKLSPPLLARPLSRR